jgi:hypothetical protein
MGRRTSGDIWLWLSSWMRCRSAEKTSPVSQDFGVANHAEMVDFYIRPTGWHVGRRSFIRHWIPV